METLEIRLNEAACTAVRLERETGCPAQLPIAQWAIESKWGEMSVGHANNFGIKRAARDTQWCTIATQEVFTPAQLETWNRQPVEIDDHFADYPSLDASCRDYAWLITRGSPYHAAWQRRQQDKNIAELIGGVARTYPTAPQYAELAEEIATQSNAVKAITEASGAPSTSAALRS